jgi:Rrf2 family protein
MLDLARHRDRPVHLKDILRRQCITEDYAEKILSALKKGGLVFSIKGPGGGYCLARRPSEIKIEDIIKATEGPLAIVDCVEDKGLCAMADGCVTRLLWKRTSEKISEVFSETTLEDLCFEAERREKRFTKRETEEELRRLCGVCSEMLKKTHRGFVEHSEELLDSARSMGRRIDVETEDAISATEDKRLCLLFSFIERIGDAIESIAHSVHTKIKKKVLFSEECVKEIENLFLSAESALCEGADIDDALCRIDRFRGESEREERPALCILLDILDSFTNIFLYTKRMARK